MAPVVVQLAASAAKGEEFGAPLAMLRALAGDDAAMTKSLERLQAFAAAHRLRVIEDAAQSMGARWQGRATMSVGDFGATSFFPSKNLGAFGDAGLITTRDAGLARECRLLRNHGMDPKYVHTRIGGNFRIQGTKAIMSKRGGAYTAAVIAAWGLLGLAVAVRRFAWEPRR